MNVALKNKMCTLSIHRDKNRVLVTMNRDEQTSRPSETPPEQWSEEPIFAPRDPVSNGTWIGMNDNGEIAALLNGYTESDSNKTYKSRGSIIPATLKGLTFQPQDFAPYHLIHIHNHTVTYSHWDGDSMQSSLMPPDQSWLFFTSSSYHQDEVKKFRQGQFNHWLKEKANFVNFIPSIHLKKAADSAYGPLMHRSDAHTKSIAQFEISDASRICRYWQNPEKPDDFLTLPVHF